jgi:hypothetical protein
MGVNVVRVYHDFGTGRQAFDILDEFYRQDIKVIMTVDFPGEGLLGDTQNITTVVNAYKNHPAILMWAVGNEWDLNNDGSGFYSGNFQTLADAAGFVEQSAELIKSLDTNHPVTTFMADPNIISFHPLSPEAFPFATARPYTSEIVSNLVRSVDVWSFNVYRGSSFQDVFQMWRSISTKPMLIGEFGADSYDHRVNGENQQMQAQFNAGLWDELYFELSAERVNGSAVGGLVFELQDEWWKNGDPFHQDISGEQNWGQPDGFNDEEYFGLTTMDRQPKEAYAAMQARYVNGQSAVALNPSPTLGAISQGPDVWGSGAEFQLDDKTVFLRGWGGPHIHFRQLVAYLKSLPNGTILALAIGDDGGFINGPGGNPWPDPYVEQGYRALEALRSQQIREVPYNGGWVMIVQKGVGVLAEAHSGPFEAVSVQAPLSLQLDPNFGRRPLFSIDDVTGSYGTGPFVFTVTRSGGIDVPATVHFATADGTATALAGDYQPVNGDLSFAPGETSMQITILVNGAANYENDVTFTVNLSGAGSASIVHATGIGTIQHTDPPPPSSAIGDISDVQDSFDPMLFPVSSVRATGLPVTGNYSTSVVMAPNQEDTASFQPNENKVVRVVSNPKTVIEPAEQSFTVDLRLAAPNILVIATSVLAENAANEGAGLKRRLG